MEQFLGKVATNILNPAIVLLFGFALVVFLWGVIKFVKDSGNEEARAIGGRHMLYGIIGMAIMISAFGILRFITNTFGFDSTPIDNIENR